MVRIYIASLLNHQSTTGRTIVLYADRQKPDYENSIKESISAVEAICCIITGETGSQATLGKTLKRLEDHGVTIHPSMGQAFSKLYGYTSDADGIRHGGIDFTNAPAEDAKYMTYYALGYWIVEEQQSGKGRAGYGKKVIQTLSDALNTEFGKGFSVDTLENARKFYLSYQDRISEALFRKFVEGKSDTLFRISDESAPFTLSWSHYLQLMRIKNPDERSFYEIEATKSAWSLRTLQRQYNSSLYERLALSRNKGEVMRLAREGNVIEKPTDIVKQPTVLEFLGLEEQAKYSETDLESAIIDKLQKFLLELGKGYLFEARQKRFTYDEENFYVDLVFYNRLLRCYVLIDLKIDKLTHQDLGQMQMYVNYYDRCQKLSDENPTIGILLCKEKNDAVVQMTLPENSNIFASEYSLYLPDKKMLQKKLQEWIDEETGGEDD